MAILNIDETRKFLRVFLLATVFSCFMDVQGEVAVVAVPGLTSWSAKKSNTSVNAQWTYSISAKYWHVCAYGVDIADSYLTLPYIKTLPAAEIHVNVSYSLKDCSISINPKSCQFGIPLYVKRNNGALPGTTDPVTTNFKKSGVFSNYTAMEEKETTKFTRVIKLGMEGKRGIYLSLRDIGICGQVTGVAINYFKCPEISENLIKFPKSPAPNSTTSEKLLAGECVANAIPISTAKDNVMRCFANGTASFSGGCHCVKGYEKIGQSCSNCPPKYFKSTAGNEACTKCGLHVVDGSLPRDKICKCKRGFFRPIASANDPAANCEDPPSAPVNLEILNINSTSATVKWERPRHNGTGNQAAYLLTVACETGCNHVISDIRTNQLSYDLENLKTYINYTVTIYSVNNVTTATGQKRGKSIGFKTKSGLPSEVRDVTKVRNDDGSVTVKWREPAAKGGPDLKYRVRYGGKTIMTVNTNITLLQTDQRQEYTVQIDSHTNAGYSNVQEIFVEIFGRPTKADAVNTNVIITVSVVCFIVLVIAIVILGCIRYRRQHPAHLKPVRLENGEVILPSGVPVYVDPTTYQDLADAVREFSKELDRQWIQLERLIGGGEFGDVYKGSLHPPLEEERIVAIKTLKSNANKKARDDFLSEAAYMGQFENPNVIGLEGVVVKDRPIMIIIEFMSNGSLDSYLQENDGKFTNMQLLGMARGVSNGMTYLAELSFIHRDLAARNILVDDNMVCKVADFGMSRELSSEETYNTTGGKIPVRWTAPEAVQFKKFTTASDVWSYGILCWEIMSYGERPYWDWGNYEVIERLATGYRLPPPMGCPKVIHDLMLSCWHKDRVKRPKFRDVRATIDKWIRNPELLRQEASVVTKRDENLDYASMKTLKEWLDSIKMGQYIDNFTNKGLVTPRQILGLTDENLKDIGILAIGHRNKIIKSINATKGQMNNELTRTKSLAV